MDDEESLECPVCTELYDEGRHTPKMMPCLHTVCASCVVDMVRKANEGQEPPDGETDVPRGKTFLCPLCREDLNTDRLQTNRYVLAHLRDLVRLEALPKAEGSEVRTTDKQERCMTPPPTTQSPPPSAATTPAAPLCRRQPLVRLRRPGQPPPPVPTQTPLPPVAQEPPPLPPRLRQEPSPPPPYTREPPPIPPRLHQEPHWPPPALYAPQDSLDSSTPPPPHRTAPQPPQEDSPDRPAPSAPPADGEMWCRTCEVPATGVSCARHLLTPLLKEEQVIYIENRQHKDRKQLRQERRELKKQHRQERRDWKLAVRMSNTKLKEAQQPTTPPSSRSTVGVCGQQQQQQTSDLSEWTYDQILKAINTSCDLEFLQVCHLEFDRRRQEYRRTIRRGKKGCSRGRIVLSP